MLYRTASKRNVNALLLWSIKVHDTNCTVHQKVEHALKYSPKFLIFCLIFLKIKLLTLSKRNDMEEEIFVWWIGFDYCFDSDNRFDGNKWLASGRFSCVHFFWVLFFVLFFFVVTSLIWSDPDINDGGWLLLVLVLKRIIVFLSPMIKVAQCTMFVQQRWPFSFLGPSPFSLAWFEIKIENNKQKKEREIKREI